MEINFKESFTIIKKMEKEFIHGKMAIYMTVNGKKIKCMV